MKRTKPIVLGALLVFASFLGSVTTHTAMSQPEKPLTEETAAPPQPADPEVHAAGPAAVRGGGFSEWFSRGGKFMWPILFCSLVAAIFVLERAYALVRARANTRNLMTDVLTALRRDGVAAAERICEQTRGPIAAIVHSGLRQAGKGPEAVEKAIETAGAVEMSFLERGLIWLATMSTVAPLLGFLGTVSGMIHAFDAIASADQVSAKLVASGISEALITTEAGLIVAIPASIAHNLFLSMIDRFVVEMEESSSELVSTLADMSPAAAVR
jgi:biopolymer transport protein ExbB